MLIQRYAGTPVENKMKKIKISWAEKIEYIRRTG